jgi:hypothetical protein
MISYNYRTKKHYRNSEYRTNIAFGLWLSDLLGLKGPKLEIFVAEFFTQTKPVWVDD